MRAHSRIFRRNNCSPKGGEGTQSQEASVGNISTHGESLQSQAPCFWEPPCGISCRDPFYICSQRSRIFSQLRHIWLGPCLPTEGSCVSLSCHRAGVHDQGHGIPAGMWWSAADQGCVHNQCHGQTIRGTKLKVKKSLWWPC